MLIIIEALLFFAMLTLVISEVMYELYHLEEWKKSGQKKILKKIVDLFSELRVHPTTGTGQVEQLKGNLSGFWSRRIDKGSRMVYTIFMSKFLFLLNIAQK